jgi:hypothetical protein
MADKTIKVKVDVEADVQPTIAELKKLKLQLKETSDPIEFKRLQQQINDTEDAIKSARTGADNFAEVLGTLPGPIGNIGSAVGGTLQNLKQFGSLKFADIKASFTELGKDVVDAGKGLLQLTGITKAYEIVTATTSKALQFFGVSLNTANTAGKALGITLSTLLAASGILAIVAAVDILTTAWDNFSKKAERAEEAQKKLNDSLLKRSKVALDAESANVKRSGDLLIAQAKARGANADEIYKIEQSNKKLLLESQQIYYNDLKNKDSDEAIAAINNIKNTQNEIKVAEANFQADKLEKSKQAAQKFAEKTKAETDKEIADRKKVLEEIDKNEKAAALSLLDEREQQKRKVVNDYNEQITLATANGKDTVILEEAKLNALRILKDKFKKEDDDKQKDIDEKEKERLNKLGEDERGIILLGLQTRLEALDAENQRIDGDFEMDLERLSEQRDILAQQEATELQNTNLTEFQKTEIRKKYADARKDITNQEVETEKAAAQAKHDINMAYLGLFEQFGNVLQQIAGKNKALAIAGIVISQAAAIGQIIANTGIANAKAVTASPLTFGQPWVAINTISAALSIASTVASAAKSIQQINSAASQAGVTGGGGGSAVSAPNIPAPRVSGAAAPEIQTTGGQNPNTQLAETLGKSQAPLKAYVVSGDVSSQQALDRRTSRAATFSGG